MSFQITESFVQEFSDNVVIQAQQKGSRLRPYVRQETIKGKAKAFDRIGAVDMVEKNGRHSNTPQLDTPHSRRWCYLKDFEWSDLIDDLDKVRILNDPTSEYVMVAYFAAGRTMDDHILKAADMIVKTGEDADGTPASLPIDQYVGAVDGSGNLGDMTVDTLRAIKQKFDEKDIDEEEARHIAITSHQLYSMLGDEKITNADYANVKALVEGKVDTFMGFKFHRLERVKKYATGGNFVINKNTGLVSTVAADANNLTAVGARKVVAWAEKGIILGVGSDVKADIGVRRDKSMATQAYISMAIGSTRMEDEKVVIALCTEA